MIGISIIKILFVHPVLIYKSCMELSTSECLNNGWTGANSVVQCAGKPYIGDSSDKKTISKIFWSPSERQMKFSLTLAKFDSWDYESVFVYKDDVLIDKITHGPLDGQHLCLNSNYPDLMEQKSYLFKLPKGTEFVKFSFRDNMDSFDIESWGIRDLALEIMDACVEFFSECNFMGNSWKLCAGNQTKMAKTVPFYIKSISIFEGIKVKLKNPRFYGGNLQTYSSNQTCLEYNVINYLNLNTFLNTKNNNDQICKDQIMIITLFSVFINFCFTLNSPVNQFTQNASIIQNLQINYYILSIYFLQLALGNFVKLFLRLICFIPFIMTFYQFQS